MPTIDLNSGNTQLYYLTEAEYHELGEWLWDGDFTTNIKKYFSSPAEAIISLSIIDYPFIAVNSHRIQIGNLDTNINATKISNWLAVNCGTLWVKEYYGNYADYNPLTQAQLYLPHVGYIDVDTDLLMDNYITIRYHIDLRSGSGLCMIRIQNARSNTLACHYQIPCHCTTSIPLSLNDKSAKVSASISALSTLGVTLGAGLATGGLATSAMAAGIASSTIGGTMSVMGAKNHTPTVSGMSDAHGLLGVKKPYLFLKRARLSKPMSYASEYGYANNTTQRIGNMHGFTKISSCHVEIDKATEEEKEEILRLLKEGIVL